MGTKALARYVFLPLLAAAILLTAGSVLSKEQKVDTPVQPVDERVPCPKPFHMTINASSPNVVNSDFTPAQLANHQGALNYTGIDKYYLYTFQKDLGKCCQITKAILTVKMKANKGGKDPKSSDAGNDAIGVMQGGSAV